jgi:hypothetical protein
MLTAFAHCIVLHRIDGPQNQLNDTGRPLIPLFCLLIITDGPRRDSDHRNVATKQSCIFAYRDISC